MDKKKLENTAVEIATFASKKFYDGKFKWDDAQLVMAMCCVMLGDDERIHHREAVETFLKYFVDAWNYYSKTCNFNCEILSKRANQEIKFEYEGEGK